MQEEKLDYEEGEEPICPYCEKVMKKVRLYNTKSGFFSVSSRTIVSCADCRKVIGFSMHNYL